MAPPAAATAGISALADPSRGKFLAGRGRGPAHGGRLLVLLLLGRLHQDHRREQQKTRYATS